MKKKIVNAVVLAFATVALASCDKNEVEVKDLDGSTYKICATEDSTSVAKAIVLATKAEKENENNILYALGLSVNFSANSDFSLMGTKGTFEINASADIAGTIGNEKYKKYEKEKFNEDDYHGSYSFKDVKEATTQLKNNIKFASAVNFGATLKNVKTDDEWINKNKTLLGISDDDIKELKEDAKKLDNSNIKFKEDTYLDDFSIYTETSLDMSDNIKDAIKDAFAGLSMPKMEFEKETYSKLKLNFDEYRPEISNMVAHYQETGSFAEDSRPKILNSMEDICFNPNSGFVSKDKLDKKYYESEEFKEIEKTIKKYGVSISNVKNEEVTFSFGLTRNDLYEGLLLTQNNTFNKSDEKILTVKATVDALTGKLLSFVLEGNNLGDSIKVLSNYLPDTILSLNIKEVDTLISVIDLLPEISGKCSLSINLKYDDKVTVKTKKHDSNKEYEETSIEYYEAFTQPSYSFSA